MREHRRWCQLRLTLLFLLTLVVAAFFAAYTLATKEADSALRFERDARDELERANADLILALNKADTSRSRN